MPYTYRSRRARPTNGSSFGGNRRAPRRNNSTGQYIDPSRFIKVATSTEEAPYQATHTFSDFNLMPILAKNLARRGYINPSPIQDQAIPVGLNGQDIIGVASTGTGKTAAFALPLLQRLLTDQGSRALIIAPTRELAQQIAMECQQLSQGANLSQAIIIGGARMSNQIRALKNRPRIVIGTPGRLKDHLERGNLHLQRFNMIVLDEVDRMLDMGFLPDVTTILKSTNPIRQSFFFSATLDARVGQLISTFANDAVTISLKASSASESVHQDVVHFQGSEDKMARLHDALIADGVSKVIVFDETQRSVERLQQELNARGFNAESIHGGRSQSQRQRALRKFKENEVSILVATDVAARGIDVADITHVINYSIPKAYDDYIHRIGRAGRAGRTGYALTFVPGPPRTQNR